jgi:hypothetical protein
VVDADVRILKEKVPILAGHAMLPAVVVCNIFALHTVLAAVAADSAHQIKPLARLTHALLHLIAPLFRVTCRVSIIEVLEAPFTVALCCAY